MPFGDIKLHPDLLRGIRELGFVKPTPIQRDAIPPALEGRDVLACAMTGSGKTAAFLLPILQRVMRQPRGTTRAHLARATLEAIAFQVRDVVDVMVSEAGLSVPELSADGGASANDLLLQLQADQLGVPVRRPRVAETTALGAAFLAGLGTGVWASTDELAATWALDRRFEPREGHRDDGRHARWRDAVGRAGKWTG